MWPAVSESLIHFSYFSIKIYNKVDYGSSYLQEELTHFEHRLKKHDYYQEQVHLSAAGLAAGSKVNHDKMPVKHEDLEKKERDYARKVSLTDFYQLNTILQDCKTHNRFTFYVTWFKINQTKSLHILYVKL